MTNILLPTDFSENAWHAFEYALELFKNETCNFYILNSFDEPSTSGYIGVNTAMAKESIYKAHVENSKSGLRTVLDKVTSTVQYFDGDHFQ